MHKIFFKHLTCLDHAYIDDSGKIRGGSCHVSVNVSAMELDESDHTVVDFSSGKKQMKSLIDSMEIGYDHKLWIIPGWSDFNSFDGVELVTDTVEIVAPSTVYRMFSYATTYNDIASELAHFLQRNMPGFEFEVFCEPVAFAPDNHSMFSYVHGLKTSHKSLGCQNIAHGHLSFVSVENDIRTQMKIAQDLHESVFIFDENIIDNNEGYLTLGYTTDARGTFLMKLKKSEYKLNILNTESTIENISQWVAKKYDTKEGTLMISEGLSKGSIV